MIIVDTSVWIDFFNGRDTPQTNTLDRLLGNEPVAIGDLILLEILQGFRSDKDYQQAKQLLSSLTIFELLGRENAIKSAAFFRTLRKQGITIRKSADVIIATFCIVKKHALLFSDKDFLPFVEVFGLQTIGASV
ncbi:MAG: PIN domain nuclease [Bacteroidota bacterium]